MNIPTERKLDEARMVAYFFEEATLESIRAGGALPAPVLMVMRFRFDRDFAALEKQVGTRAAVETIATVAFLAGRKAERAGLVHEPEEVTDA